MDNVDFKQASDTVRRGQLYNAMAELGIPREIINLIEMTLSDSECRVKNKKKVENRLQ